MRFRKKGLLGCQKSKNKSSQGVTVSLLWISYMKEFHAKNSIVFGRESFRNDQNSKLNLLLFLIKLGWLKSTIQIFNYFYFKKFL